MFGLTRDFQQNGGTYMVLGGMQGIHSRDISMVQAGMITASKIPNFLPLRIKELDLYVTLQYDISDKKMLSHMLKSNKISMNEYYHLLLQTAVLLENSKLYMLNAERYILHEDYIFIEGTLQSGKLYFTYVPVESLVYDQSLSNLLKELITRMMASVSELRGAGVQKLLQFVSGDTFSVTGFKDLILGLLTLTEDSEEPNKASREPIIENNSIDVSKQQYTRKSFRDEIQHTDHQDKLNSKSNKLQENHRLKQHQHDRGEGIIQQKLVPDRESSSVWGQDLFSNGAYQISGTDPDDDEGQEPSKSKVYILLGSLLAAAIIWRLIYMSSPSTSRLIICMLLTALLAGSAWIGWSGRFSLPHVSRNLVSGELASLGTGELDNAFKDQKKKRQPRFQVEKLTGYLGGGRKRLFDHDHETNVDHISKSNWKWTFPQKEEMDYSQPSSQKSSVKPSQRVESVLRQNRREGENLEYSSWNQVDPMSTTSQSNYNQDIHPYFLNQEDNQDYYSQLGQKTEMLNPSSSNATVLLQPLEKPNSSDYRHGMIKKLIYLERSEDGQPPTSRIELNLPHFIIGRSDEVAQFIEQTAGTSRAHVELSKGPDGNYMIKDLGSKNGTILLGEPMIPYKEYKLNDSDTFTIVKGTYTYHVS